MNSPLFLIFVGVKQKASNVCRLDDQRTQSIGSLAVSVTDFRKQEQQKR